MSDLKYFDFVIIILSCAHSRLGSHIRLYFNHNGILHQINHCAFLKHECSYETDNFLIHSYSCAFDISGTLEIFLPLKFERHVVPLNSPKFLQLIVFKLLLHLRGFTVVTLKY